MKKNVVVYTLSIYNYVNDPEDTLIDVKNTLDHSVRNMLINDETMKSEIREIEEEE